MDHFSLTLEEYPGMGFSTGVGGETAEICEAELEWGA